MKEKLNRAKTWYATRFKADPEKTLAGTLTLGAAVVGLFVKISDAQTSRSKAKTWKREVERRERQLDRKYH